MPAGKESLADKLSRYRQITISVTGRKSGQTISIPVWFVLEDRTLYLLPVKGSDTQWYRNVQKNPKLKLSARGEKADLDVKTVSDEKQVASVIDKFRAKYGAAEVKKYYSKFDVAVTAQLK